MAEVVLKNLTKRYDDVVAVSDLSAAIADREFVVLLGPSGCGKTTILRMIAGLEEVTAGEIYIDGHLVNNVAPKDRDIAMVFQNYALYPHMSVYENMAFGLRLRKVPRKEIDERVHEAARILAIEDLLRRKPKQLSGGQRQRVALGRAIVRNPKVFLMDEPLSNLDAKLRVHMRTEIARLRHRLQATIVYVTHDQTEAMTMADRIIILKDGHVMQIGAPQQVYDHPANVFVAGFIGSPAMNFIDAAVTDHLTLKCPFFELETTAKTRKIIKEHNLAGREVLLGIRPEDLEDSAFAPAALRGGSIEARVDIIEPMGAEVYVYISLGDTRFTARVNPRTAARHGGRITLSVDLDRIHLFNKDTGAAYGQGGSWRAESPPFSADPGHS